MGTADNTVYEALLGHTSDLDGVTMTAALTTSAYIPQTTDPDLDSITGEATGTGYARQTFTCSITDQVCYIADADQWPEFDTSALDNPHNRVVVALGEDVTLPDTTVLPTGTLVSNFLYGDQAPSSAWPFEPAAGFARPRRTPIVPVPSPDDEGKVPTVDGDGNYALTTPATAGGGTDGQVWTTDGTTAGWEDLPGGAGTVAPSYAASFFGQINPPHAAGSFPAIDLGATISTVSGLPSPIRNHGFIAYGTTLSGPPTFEDVPAYWVSVDDNPDAARFGTTVPLDAAIIQSFLPGWSVGDPLWIRNDDYDPDGLAVCTHTFYESLTEDDTNDVTAWLLVGTSVTEFAIAGAVHDTEGTATTHTIALGPWLPRIKGHDVEYNPTNSGLSSIDVQAAIDEVAGLVGGGGTETTTSLGTLISGATAKTTPVDADLLPLSDSAASNVVKKLTWANVKATLKTYFDTLYDASGAAAAVTAASISAAPTSRTVTAGTGLTGGGDLSANRTFAIDTSVTVDKTSAQTLTNKTLTSPAITTPTGIVKGDVGLGSVTNDAQLKIASNLSDLANAGTARTNLGLGSLATASTITSADITNGTIVDADLSSSAAISLSKLTSVPNAIRVIAATRTTGSTPIATPIVAIANGPTTRALALGEQLFCRALHTGQTLTKLYVLVSATSLTGSQTIEVECYNDQGDSTPGTRVWAQSITVGTSTGTLDSGTVSLAMPTGPCFIAVLNPSGNAGTVTLRVGSPMGAAMHTAMQNGIFAPVLNLTSVASSTSDASAYLLRSASTGNNVLGIDASATFPIIGAIT